MTSMQPGNGRPLWFIGGIVLVAAFALWQSLDGRPPQLAVPGASAPIAGRATTIGDGKANQDRAATAGATQDAPVRPGRPAYEDRPARGERAPRETRAPASPADFPPELRASIATIQRGAPFAHRQDGSVFGNFERRLPAQPRGYYHEYTVPTPGLNHRGTRRVITGGTPPREWYYTGDHYEHFTRFDPATLEIRP